jgi:hypothetical protein
LQIAAAGADVQLTTCAAARPPHAQIESLKTQLDESKAYCRERVEALLEDRRICQADADAHAAAADQKLQELTRRLQATEEMLQASTKDYILGAWPARLGAMLLAARIGQCPPCAAARPPLLLCTRNFVGHEFGGPPPGSVELLSAQG